MFHPIELSIGVRYLRAKRRNHFISFISFISIIGIALGIMVLITVLSVMNGFQKEVRERILSMAAHNIVTELGGVLHNWPALAKQLEGKEHIVGMAPFVSGQAMLINGSRVSGALLEGVSPEFEIRVSEIKENLQEGSLDDLADQEYRILLGSELADYLGTAVNDKIIVITPEATVTPAGILPQLRRFTVSGIYRVGMGQYDRNTAIIHIEDAKRLFRLKDAVSGLRIKLKDIFDAPAITRELQEALGGNYWVSDWTLQHSNFFRALRMEKTMMFIIMVLIVAVAAFNIVSTLVMLVTDKQSDIAILRTLGISPNSTMWIFMILGILIGAVGTLLGAISGILLSLNLEKIVKVVEDLLHTKFLAPDVYYISDFPSHIMWGDVITVCVIAFLLTVLATIYPAWRAARTQPAEALRYE